MILITPWTRTANLVFALALALALPEGSASRWVPSLGRAINQDRVIDRRGAGWHNTLGHPALRKGAGEGAAACWRDLSDPPSNRQGTEPQRETRLLPGLAFPVQANAVYGIAHQQGRCLPTPRQIDPDQADPRPGARPGRAGGGPGRTEALGPPGQIHLGRIALAASHFSFF